MPDAPLTASDAGLEDGSWQDPPRRPPAPTSPVLTVDGFEGPLDWLLEMVRARKLDLRRLSILALVEAFGKAMDRALTPGLPVSEVARWATWTVMAAQLAELRSRLLLPADAPDAQAAQAEALQRHWISRAEMAAAADWLERRPQLGRDVFARGRAEAAWGGQGASPGRAAAAWDQQADADDEDDVARDEGDELTGLLRACLVVLRLPADQAVYRPRRLPFWSVTDAIARITRMLPTLPEGAVLEAFLPDGVEHGAGQAVHRRAALAATLIAGLELAREGTLVLQQVGLRPIAKVGFIPGPFDFVTRRACSLPHLLKADSG